MNSYGLLAKILLMCRVLQNIIIIWLLSRVTELNCFAQSSYLTTLTLSLDICQWAIFAIRNLLENNTQNQSIVSSLDRQGLADTARLRQFGVEAVELDNGRIKLVPMK